MIRLQFVREPYLSSDTIAWFSAGKFSHVDAVLPEGWLLGARSDRCGARKAGVQIRRPDYARFSCQVIASLPCTEAQEAVFYGFLNAQLGKPYDSLAILGFFTGRDWREDDSWICSELQAAALEGAGITPRLYLAANKITPVALALAVSALPGIEFCGLGPSA